MNKSHEYMKDPVCEMQVKKDSLAIIYQDMNFAFCSQQCQDRFLANPHLYIGYPGQKAPKQEGEKVMKHRRISLQQALSADEISFVEDALFSMMGVRDVKVTFNTIEIEYDLLQATLQQLENTLDEIGLELGNGWSERLRRAFAHESEEWQIDSMEVTQHTHIFTNRHADEFPSIQCNRKTKLRAVDRYKLESAAIRFIYRG